VPGPETTQPATTPDQSALDYGIDAAFESEMSRWDQAQLEAFWRESLDLTIRYGGAIAAYRSPTGDEAIEARINQIIEDYVAEHPTLQTSDRYGVNRAQTTDSSGPNVAQGADPVNLFDGDFVYSATDFQIDGAGIDFIFTRSYSQLCSYRGPLGANWDHRYNLWLRIVGDGTIIQRSDGALHEQTFRRHEQHQYWMPPDGGRGVIFESGASFVHRFVDGVQVFYLPHPTLHPTIHIVSRIEDRFGNYLEFAYTDDRLARVRVNHPDRVLDFRYDTDGRVTIVRDFVGRTWQYDYDDLGDLVAVTTPATSAHPRGLTTSYSYSSSLNGDPQLQHLLTSILDADGRLYLENEYGTASGLVNYRRVIRQRQGGGDMHFEYADVVEEFDVPYEPRERPTHQTVVTERDGRQVRHLFNRYGQMLFREEWARIDGVPRLVSSHFRYNRDGNLIATLSPLGGITQFFHERELYETIFPTDDDYRPESDANLTAAIRLGFDNVRSVVKRGRYYDLNALNLAGGLWKRDIFPNALQISVDDVIQKFTYEPEFGQVLTVSDPRVTRSSDPRAVEGAEYDQLLTRLEYAPGSGFQNLLLNSLTLPTPTLPDGTPSQPVRTTFAEYDDRGRPLRAIAPNGLEIHNTYADASAGARAGFLQTTTLDPAGIALSTGAERDALGRAVKTYRPSYFDLQDERFFTVFEFDELNRIVTSISTAPFSIATRNVYTRTGRLARTETELKNEANELVGTLVNANRYDDEHNLIAQTFGDAPGEQTKRSRVIYDRAARPYFAIAPSGRKRKDVYNERSLISKTIDDYGGVDATTRAFYDAEGRLIRVFDPRGNAVRFGYDVLGRLVDTTDALGNRVIRHFDKLGHLLVECHYERAAAGTFRLLARSQFSYDELGRLVVVGANRFETTPSVPETNLHTAFRVTGPGQLLTVLSFFDNVGNLVKTVDQAGRTFVCQHDLLGRATLKQDPDGNELRFRYDKEGNVVRLDSHQLERDPTTNSVIGNYHFAEVFAYDELNRLIEHRTTTSRRRNRFDSRGNIVEAEDPRGHRSRNAYDVFGRLVENVQFYSRDQSDVPEPLATTFTYDADDRKLTQTDALGRVTRFRYDTAGRLVATILPDGTEDSTTYDRSGNVIAHRNHNGLLHAIDWDALNRPTALRVDATTLSPEGSFAGGTTYLAEYDSLGRFTRVENDFVGHRYIHDSLGQQLRETTWFNAATGLDPAREYNLARQFSATGALTELIYSSGRTLQYGHDALDRVVSVQQVSRGTAYPGDTATPDQHTLATLGYVGSRIRRVNRLNGISSVYRHDYNGRTVELRHQDGVNPVLTVQLLHDAAGNPRRKTEAATEFEVAESFDYDSLSRLYETHRATSASLLDLSAIAPASAPLPEPLPDLQANIDSLLSSVPVPTSATYDYDLVGNRLASTRDGVSETYQANVVDQYEHVGAASLRYDANGNLVEDARFRYSYDYRNQLTRFVRKADGRATDLLRDYFGRSSVERDTTRVTVNIFDGRELLEQFENDQVRRSIAHGPTVDGVIAVAAGGHDLFLLPDVAGSVRYVFDGLSRSEYFVYDEFGNLRQSLTSGVDNPFRFAGKMPIGDTGKYDFVFRVYDPALGRFMQRDPKGYVDGSNLYSYVRNSPLAFRDPDGLESRTEQAINAGVYAGHASATPIDVAGKPLSGTYNLWSGDPGPGKALAKAAPGWIMGQTPEHAAAKLRFDEWRLQNPRVNRLPPDLWDDIWVRPSIEIARRAMLARMPVASWGLDTVPNPTDTVQYKYELPAVRKWGTISGLGTIGSGVLNIYAASQVDNPYVKGVGVTGGSVEVLGGALYLTGALRLSTALMKVGSTFSRFGGGAALTVVGGYQFVQDVRHGDAGGAIGSGANAATGIAMLAAANPYVVVGLATFAFSYNGSRWIRSETGWGDRSGKAGASVANYIMGNDPGVARKAVGYGAGLIVTSAGVLVVEPVGFAGKKIGHGASWGYDKVTDLIGYEFDF
jgi:RHS repeat-associated protein